MKTLQIRRLSPGLTGFKRVMVLHMYNVMRGITGQRNTADAGQRGVGVVKLESR